MHRILIVEDEAMVATGLEMLLEDEGFSVVGWAVDAAEALRLAEECRPALALVDIQLRRGDDGVAVALELSERWGVEIIFLTAQSDPKTQLRAQQVKHRAYVVKPYAPADLISIVTAIAQSYAFGR